MSHLRVLEESLEYALGEENYELAAELRDEIELVKSLSDNAAKVVKGAPFSIRLDTKPRSPKKMGRPERDLMDVADQYEKVFYRHVRELVKEKYGHVPTESEISNEGVIMKDFRNETVRFLWKGVPLLEGALREGGFVIVRL